MSSILQKQKVFNFAIRIGILLTGRQRFNHFNGIRKQNAPPTNSPALIHSLDTDAVMCRARVTPPPPPPPPPPSNIRIDERQILKVLENEEEINNHFAN